MKRFLILFLILICGLFVKAQFPLTQSVGNKNMLYATQGAFGADSGYVYRYGFPDTATANIGYLKNIPGITIRTTDDLLWMRNNTATAWVQVGKRLVYENGLTLANDTVRWGGALTDSTIITQNGNFIKFVGGNIGVNILGAPSQSISIGNNSGNSQTGDLMLYATSPGVAIIETNQSADLLIRGGNTVRIVPDYPSGGLFLFNNLSTGIAQSFFSGGGTEQGRIGLENSSSGNTRFFYIKAISSDTIPAEIAIYDSVRFINIQQNDLNTKILTINSSNDRLQWRDASSLSGGSGNVYAENGLSNVNDSTVRLGGTLLDTTDIAIPQATRFRLLANGANGYMLDSQKPPWLVFKSSDTINTYAYANVGAATFFQQNVYFNNNRTNYFKGHEFWSEWKNADSTWVYSVGGDFGFVARNTLNLTRDAAADSRRVFLGGTVDFDAVPNTIAWTRLQRPTGHSSPIRARGWWSGFTAYPINLWGADTLDNYIGFASFSQIGATAKVLKYYDFYAAGGGYTDSRVDSAWSLFSNRDQRLFHEGPVAFGGNNTGPSEQLELVGNFKHYDLRSSNAADDSMVVWNETDKMYGKRPLSSAGLLFARTDARNETGAAMSFSAAGEDFTIDSVGGFTLQSTPTTFNSPGNFSLQENNIYFGMQNGDGDELNFNVNGAAHQFEFQASRLIDNAGVQFNITADSIEIIYDTFNDPITTDTTDSYVLLTTPGNGVIKVRAGLFGGSGGSVNLGNTDLTQSAATRNYDIDDQNLYWLNTGTWRIYGAATHSGDRLMEIDGTNSLGYFGPDAGSVFWGFNADSLLIDGIGLRNDSTNYKVLVYNPTTNTVSYSNWLGGGGSSGPSFGTDNQVPFTNSGGTDFDYSANFTFDGQLLLVSPTSGTSAIQVANNYGISGTNSTGSAARLLLLGADNGPYIGGVDATASGTLRIRQAGTDRITVTSALISLNTLSGNIDLNWNGDNVNNVLYGDASADRVGIKTTTPGFDFDVNGMINTPGTNASTYRWAASAVTSPTTAGAFSTPTNYFGANITNVLGTPDAWVTINIGGSEYALPAYSVVAP